MKYKFLLFIFALIIFSVSAEAQLLRIKTIAGNGEQGYDGDGLPAPGAMLSGPLGVAVDGTGNVYIEDFYNFRVRKVNTNGIITTYAGNGFAGNSGDGSIGSNATIDPHGIAVDKYGNLYISDASYSSVRKVNTLGIISKVAGNNTFGYKGDGGPATNAALSSPYGLAVDTAGNLFIADASRHVVRKVSKNGIISTVAGSDTLGYMGDGGPATNARLDSPFAVAVDRRGNLFISDHKNNVIRKVNANHIITTYAGVYGNYNYSGDGGPAFLANLNSPQGIAVDTNGNLFIADAENDVIRKVDTFGIITTVVGNGTRGFGGDLGYALGANLHNPYGVAIDVFGDIFIADANNQRIRMVYNPYLAVNNIEPKVNLGLFPNPFTDRITVNGLGKSDKVCVYDLVGRQVSDVWEVKNEGSQTFMINNLAAGLYLLQVWDGEGNKKAVAKLVKE